MSTKQLTNYCLHLRPHEFCYFIYSMKVLKKYNRLEKTDLFENTFNDILKHTPYPFSWNIYYKSNNTYTYVYKEKKVLFEYSIFNNHFQNPYLPYPCTQTPSCENHEIS